MHQLVLLPSQLHLLQPTQLVYISTSCHLGVQVYTVLCTHAQALVVCSLVATTSTYHALPVIKYLI